MISEGFKTVLIPVDFSPNTEVAVKHAIDLCAGSENSIHLLHINSPYNEMLNEIRKQEMISVKMNKLQHWQEYILTRLPGCKVETSLQHGILNRILLEYCRLIKPQLIIIAKKNNHNFFRLSNQLFPNVIANLTGYPVFTVMTDSIDQATRKIVLPVRTFVPERKIQIASVFAKQYRTRIHLVGLSKSQEDMSVNKTVFETYRILKNRISSKVEFSVLNSSNFARDIISFSDAIDADMLIVNPWDETLLPGYKARHINDIIESTSKLKVLSVVPFPYNRYL